MTPKANLDLWTRLDEVCRIHTVEFERVQGHAGNNYNERADRLAWAAIPRGE
ncbi:MAG: RNase [Thermacetogenium sp.]|nr:RNase [Thermacetogenium sp.]